MKQEARLWQLVREKMWRPGDRLTRIENSILSGAPDVNGCLAGEDVWVELKAPVEPKRPGTPLMTSNGNHPLLLTQQGWMKQQQQAGGIAFILLRTDKRMLLIDGTKYGTGEHFNKYTVAQMIRIAIFSCDVPTKQEDWRLLRNVIFTASRHRRLHHHASAQQLLADLEQGEGNVAGDREPGRPSPVEDRPKPPGRARGRRREAGRA